MLDHHHPPKPLPRLSSGASVWQLTNVDPTLTTMLQRCANNVLQMATLIPFMGKTMYAILHTCAL